jgi:LmeA-like phospholipid-binding
VLSVVRLFKRLVLLALVVIALGLVAFVLGRPFVERLAARSIEDRLGTPVSVSIATSISPSIARGDLGNVTVRAKHFERDGLMLAGAHAVYRGVHMELSDLVSGDVRLRYSSVSFQGSLTEAALTAYLRPLLAERGLSSKNLRVTITKGVASLRMGKQRAALGARIVGLSSIKLVPVSGSKPLMRALAAPIQLGPLFDGVHLTDIVLRKGRATLTGSGEGGKLRA